ncbi:MAG: imidazoleglycerol-phosphate dehydratase HisB [Clostridia bacterium]|nr:imidazoleglycerol-phosphate dehydratase HisB [Clostridia bacterium]
MRSSQIERNTKETQINLTLNLDGAGKFSGSSGVGFFDHMLDLFSKHSGFDLDIKAKGDTWVDDHHTVEDIGICLGKAFRQACGDMAGIERYGNIILPMDEALIMCALDVGGRSLMIFDCDIPGDKVGSFDTELVEEFMAAFVRNADINLHIKRLEGRNSHHIIEGIFKAFARSLKSAVTINEKNNGEIPSTKGVI